MLKSLLAALAALVIGGSASAVGASPSPTPSLDSLFASPPQEAKPLMIWQWMDGLVSAEGITRELEAFREAGIGGVQQFLVGGAMQTHVADTLNAIGTDSWRRLMQHAIGECRRLGLTFGTHNCPGWSSSAFPTVKPEYAMQKLVYSQTELKAARKVKTTLPRPEVDATYNYYEDVAVLAFPMGDVIDTTQIVDLTAALQADGTLRAKLPAKGDWRIVRFGRTTNGKTNVATAPTGGVGLECDKMSREAVAHYWSTYPAMLLSLAGKEAGRTWQRIEIDSYEAGGQDWSPVLPAEFLRRRGYDLRKWLPTYAGYTVGSEAQTKQFRKDLEATVTDLFAENYYEYMAELAHQSGLKLLYQPYGTGGSKPFNPLNTWKIVAQLPTDYVCAEFWSHPDWGWKDVPRVTDAAHKNRQRLIFAEGFTCWPLYAWQDDPSSIKAIADRAFAMGINALMLHAGAHTPWQNAKPGMSFGIWGTQFTPGLTWWKDGAKALFGYMARCQSLLQQGEYIDDYRSRSRSLSAMRPSTQWLHRKADGADIYFVANSLDSLILDTLTIASTARRPEVWLPESGKVADAVHWDYADGHVRVALKMQPRESAFIILRHPAEGNGTGLELPHEERKGELALDEGWTLRFPEGMDCPESVALAHLTPWNEHADEGIHYFSGTATYAKHFQLKRLDPQVRYVIDLGEVKNTAKLRVNGKEVAYLWNAPFRADITDALRKGDNLVEVDVTNLWPNRMIGDEQWPDDMVWSEPYCYPDAPGKPEVGRFMERVPTWLAEGKERPSSHRKTITSFKFFKKDTPLLRSGMMGPVKVEMVK